MALHICMPATHSQLNFAHASSSSVVDPFNDTNVLGKRNTLYIYICHPYIESATALSDKQLMN